ncbi:hypothetical protein LCGC14_2327450 [marine sediment metagenome]|uniref:Uncharacterized protein n=1 Tax=marine sediment metagenome TaxID=412755 RepID=A0A0F9D3J7_9ZZZZ
MDGHRAKIRRIFLKGLTLVLCSVAIVAMIGVLWFKAGQDKFLHKEKSAKIFIGQIIDSVRADTEFYRTKTESNIIAKVEASHNLMSSHYVVSTIDYSWDIYECTILFNNETKIKVDVAFQENEPYMLTNWRQIE